MLALLRSLSAVMGDRDEGRRLRKRKSSYKGLQGNPDRKRTRSKSKMDTCDLPPLFSVFPLELLRLHFSQWQTASSQSEFRHGSVKRGTEEVSRIILTRVFGLLPETTQRSLVGIAS